MIHLMTSPINLSPIPLRKQPLCLAPQIRLYSTHLLLAILIGWRASWQPICPLLDTLDRSPDDAEVQEARKAIAHQPLVKELFALQHP
jgi:hypothetical protein